MTAFDEVRFPVEIAMGSSGGPRRQTQIVVKGSGFESRNARWVNSRREYDISYGIRSMNDLHATLEFFEARNAQLIAFRLKDWADFQSVGPKSQISPTDQNIGTGDAVTTTFQLVKVYASGPSSWTRTIKKPVAGTTVVALNGVKQNTGWSVDTTTGIVTFVVAPGVGVAVTVGYQFDTPVRFNTDMIQVNLSEAQAGRFPSIPMIEVFL
jgi:uncharacterized protein (TIGR02217 family)